MESNYIANDNVNTGLAAGFAQEDSFLDSALYYHLFYEAEKVRWKISDIPWSAIEKDKVNPGLISLVRDIAFSELATWSATNSFLQAFAGDIDFSQWLTVWLYEETKHPQALMLWLKQFGESFDMNFMAEGRKIYPPIKSPIGNLVMNTLSEIEASSLYVLLYSSVEEPVLKRIAKNLGADEARHASGFFSYAKKTFDSSDEPDVARLQALQVLSFWLLNHKRVKHPVALISRRIMDNHTTQFRKDPEVESEKVFSRMRSMIGNLVGLELKTNEDVYKYSKELHADLGPVRI